MAPFVSFWKKDINNFAHSLMKKLPLLCLSLSVSVCAFSQTLVKEMENADTRFIPGAYMKNGEAAIYFSSDEYGYGTKGYAQIFDFELKPLKEFSFSYFHPYTVYESRQSTGTKVLTRTLSRETGEWTDGVPSTSDMEARKEAFIQMLYDMESPYMPSLTLDYLRSNARTDGTTVFVGFPIDNNTPYDFQEYLKSVEYYLLPDNKFGVACNYATTVNTYDGDWQGRQSYDVPVRNLIVAKCYDVANLNDWNGGLWLPFSQTFFNDDEKFEYVRMKAEVTEGSSIPDSSESEGWNEAEFLFGITSSDRDGDGEEDIRSIRYGLHISGIEIVTEDGNIVYSIPLGADCADTPHVEIFKSDNHILAQIEYHWYDSDNKYTRTNRFYRIDKTSGVAKVVREETKVAATPNPAPAGTPVVMTIPEGSDRRVEVSNLNGAVMASYNVGATSPQVSVPTANLSSGLYLFSVIVDGRMVDTCKIIIR